VLENRGRDQRRADPPAALARPGVPSYVDATIDDFAQGGEGRFHHLGHWDDPAHGALAFGRHAAQQRMNDIIVERAGVRDGSRVLDAGSGFGGTLAAIDRRFDHMDLVGIDIDERQLRICRRLSARRGNVLSWVNADACRLPFGDETFDHVVSIEAMWHFPSRRDFLAEAARVLRAGGRLVAVDVLISAAAPSILGRRFEDLVDGLAVGFAPWPEPGGTVEAIVDAAEASGLRCAEVTDATENTKPTYLDHGDSQERPDAAGFSATEPVQLFVDMHQRDALQIVYFTFERRPRSR
jgi:SAM-dependent methyltransferase